MQIDLSGKVALITGATGDLGRVMTRTLAACGADMAIHYLNNEKKAEELAGEVRAMGRRAITVQADITSLESVLAMEETVRQALGSPDIVVANAVIQYKWTTILNQPAEDYESQFRSCVMQNVFLAKAFIPAMVEKKGGRYIGINTECALQCTPTESAYVSGKRGMDGVLRVLAREVGRHGITVNQVAPGWTVSDRDRAAGTESSPDYERRVPMGRRGTDQEIANAVAFLASGLASFITGAILPVSGGTVMPAI